MINRITLLLFIGLVFLGCEEDNDELQSDTLVIEVKEEREDCYESRIKFVGQGDNNI